jgi:peptidase E
VLSNLVAVTTRFPFRHDARVASDATEIRGQIVVSGGAGFWCGTGGLALDCYALSLTGKAKPKVCFVPTASGDSAAFIAGFYDGLGPLCQPSHLALFLPPFTEPTATLGDQDMIYVGGGSTPNMLAIWRLHGVDEMLRNALERGAILYGSSAGALCWFESGVTDSLGLDGALRPLTNGLGFLRGSHCPHFDLPERRSSHLAMVRDGRLGDGIGVDDLAAAHYVDGVLHAVVSAADGATAHRVERGPDGDATATALPSRTL